MKSFGLTTTDIPVPVEASSRDLQLPLPKIKPLSSCTLFPRSSTFFASFNCRTLTAQWRRYELVNYCIIHRIMILSIQEHRIFFEPSGGDLFRREQLCAGWWFIYTSASSAGVGGVGFFISPKAYKELCGVKFISSRIISVKLGNSHLSPVYILYTVQLLPLILSTLPNSTRSYRTLLIRSPQPGLL